MSCFWSSCVSVTFLCEKQHESDITGETKAISFWAGKRDHIDITFENGRRLPTFKKSKINSSNSSCSLKMQLFDHERPLFGPLYALNFDRLHGLASLGNPKHLNPKLRSNRSLRVN